MSKFEVFLANRRVRCRQILQIAARCPRLPVVVFEAGIAVRNTLPIGWGQGKRDDQRSLCATDVLMSTFGGSAAMDEAWLWHIRFRHEH